MKRTNKGFTLIELLAIIVILAIIAVITVPLILNIINDAQKNASIDSAYGYKSALEKYYMKKVVENTENELPSGSISILSLPYDFSAVGELPSDGWIGLSKGIVTDFSLKYNDYVVTKFSHNDISVKKINSLPYEYQRVEYIQSTGSQYIDTEAEIFASANHDIVVDVEPTRFYNYNTIWGSTRNADSNESWIYKDANLFYRYNGWAYSSEKEIVELNNWYFIHYKKVDETLSVSVNNIAKPINTTTTPSVNASLLLFLSGSDYGEYKLRNCKVYDNNELIRDFIPCYRKSDNKTGLYDTVNNVFYANDGEGEFIAGPEI